MSLAAELFRYYSASFGVFPDCFGSLKSWTRDSCCIGREFFSGVLKTGMQCSAPFSNFLYLAENA